MPNDFDFDDDEPEPPRRRRRREREVVYVEASRGGSAFQAGFNGCLGVGCAIVLVIITIIGIGLWLGSR